MGEYTTRFFLTQSGWTGAICRRLEDGPTMCGFAVEFGSKRAVRRALRRKWRAARIARSQVVR